MVQKELQRSCRDSLVDSARVRGVRAEQGEVAARTERFGPLPAVGGRVEDEGFSSSTPLLRIALKKPFSDGTVAIDLDPLSLLCRLAATVPPPRFHTVRYAGVLASASKWRPLIVPKPEPSANADHDDVHPGALDSCAPPPRCETTGSRYRPWAELLKRTFGIDVETCPRCGGRMRLLALITEPPSVARFLRHLGEPTEPPPRAPARDPPYWQSRVLRRRHHEPSAQIGLFEEH